jgi:RHS repeat-associated protein
LSLLYFLLFEIKHFFDPLGRRMSKSYNGRITKWVWDGNVILHEWVEHFEDVSEEDEIPDSLQSDEISAVSLQAQLDGRPSNGPPESGELPLPTTWLFDPDTFAPASKIVGDKHYSIITDHLGTPLSMFDETGVQTWGAELDIFGSVKNLHGDKCDCPFRYPGQYEDCETGLYYNRYRYYDAESGEYVSQDPIGLLGGWTLYQYTVDQMIEVDPLGLASFFSVQGLADATRLRSGGAPWPTGLERANMGQGFYSWASETEALNYKALLERHGRNGLEIVKFDIDDASLASLKRLDLRTMSDDAVDAWMEEFSHYGKAKPHSFEYVIRRTNIGNEHYFSKEVFGNGCCK